MTQASDPYLSPDGAWRWNGSEWLPNFDVQPFAPPHPTGRERRAAARAESARGKAEHEFAQGAVGLARAAFARGDLIYQASLDLASHKSTLFKFQAVDSDVADPNLELNGIAHEGWRLISASVTYVQGTSGNLNATAGMGSTSTAQGRSVGHYVFWREEGLRAPQGSR